MPDQVNITVLNESMETETVTVSGVDGQYYYPDGTVIPEKVWLTIIDAINNGNGIAIRHVNDSWVFDSVGGAG